MCYVIKKTIVIEINHSYLVACPNAGLDPKVGEPPKTGEAEEKSKISLIRKGNVLNI